MRGYLLLGVCLLITGCGRGMEGNRDVLNQLAAIKSDLATRENPLRWAVANKKEIDSAISSWSHDKLEEFKKSENLSPEMTEKVHQYETLKGELIHKQMESFRVRMSKHAYPLEPTPSDDPEYDALAKRVADARMPVAEIMDRRDHQSAEYQHQYATEVLIAEYAKDRFDLVIGAADEPYTHTGVLYHKSAEVIDITEGVIRLLKEKTKS
jgi:hypothetical protein